MSKKIKLLIIMSMVFIVGLALLVWPVNIKIIPVTMEYSSEQILFNREIKKDNPYIQKISLTMDYLDEFGIWIDSISSDQDGAIQVILKDASKQILFKKIVPLEAIKCKKYNKIKVGENIRPGKYSIKIKALGCGQDGFCIGLLDHQNGRESAALNYRGRKSMDRMQTIICWMLLFELWILIVHLLCSSGTNRMWQIFKSNKIQGQVSVIMGVISLFCFSAVLSPAVTWEKSWRTLWPSLVIWIMFFTCILKLRGYGICWKSIKIREHLPLILLILANGIIRFPMLESMQRWDAGEYYYALGTACKNFQFDLQSLIKNFRLCSHSTLGFSLVAAIGEFFTPRNSIGVLVVSFILTLVAIGCLYYLIRDSWLKCGSWLAAGFALIISFTPIFLGTFAYVTPDYFLAVYLICKRQIARLV